MDPYQSMTFDNRPRVAQFIDGGPITDGMANLAAALFQAPLAAAQIRRQREADQLGQLWRQKEFDRQAAQDQLARLWHEQATLRQADQDAQAADLQKVQIENIRADNTRQSMGMLGTGLNNAAARGIDAVKAIGQLFRHPGTAGERNGWSTFKGDDGMIYKINRSSGEIQPAVSGSAPATAPATAPALPSPPTATAEPTMPTGQAMPDGPGDTFWTPRRSGQPGIHSLGDVSGGLYGLWGLRETLRQKMGLDQPETPQPDQQPVDDNRPPEWRAAKIDMGGMNLWHKKAKEDPEDFARQLMQLKTANDPRYPVIIAELRRRAAAQ